MYYLQSRYYNPGWGRFINADTTNVLTASPGNATWDKNLFAYCDNNPISRKDDGGQFWNIAVGAGIGLAINVVSQIAGNCVSGDPILDGVFVAAITGAASGALSATGFGKGIQAFGNAAISLVAEAATQYRDGTLGSSAGFNRLIKATVSGFAAGLIGGDGIRHKSGNYYKAAQDAKSTMIKVLGKSYGNPNTPAKLISQAANKVIKVGRHESLTTGIKFGVGSISSQILTRW